MRPIRTCRRHPRILTPQHLSLSTRLRRVRTRTLRRHARIPIMPRPQTRIHIEPLSSQPRIPTLQRLVPIPTRHRHARIRLRQRRARIHTDRPTSMDTGILISQRRARIHMDMLTSMDTEIPISQRRARIHMDMLTSMDMLTGMTMGMDAGGIVAADTAVTATPCLGEGLATTAASITVMRLYTWIPRSRSTMPSRCRP